MDVPPTPVDPEIMVVTGAMAAGKSAVAEALAHRFTRSVHLRGDVFRRMVVRGRADVTPDAGPDADRQLRLRYRLAVAAAEAYAAEGFAVVYQDVILGEHLADVVASIAHRPLSVVVLCPRPDVLAAREAGRSKAGYGLWAPADLDRLLRRETPLLGLWLDTSDLEVDETVEVILGDEGRMIGSFR